MLQKPVLGQLVARGGAKAGHLQHLDSTATPTLRSPCKLCFLCCSPTGPPVDPLQAWLPVLQLHLAVSGSLASIDPCASAPPGRQWIFALQGLLPRELDFSSRWSLAFGSSSSPGCALSPSRAVPCLGLPQRGYCQGLTLPTGGARPRVASALPGSAGPSAWGPLDLAGLCR